MSRRVQIEQMLQTDPEDVFLQYALALEYVKEGDVAGGLQRLDQLTRRHPDYVAAYFRQGQILAEQGEIEPARAVIARGLEAARRVGDTHTESEMTAFLEVLED